MSAPFIVPFNFQPVSTSNKTASYTIPAGKYALVKTFSPFFSIGGVNQYPSFTLSVTAVYPGGSNFTVTNSFELAGSSYVYSASVTGTASNFNSGSYGGGIPSSYNLPISSRTNTGSLNAAYNPSSMLFIQAITNVGTITTDVSLYYFSTTANEFWVQPGAVLNGNNYLVAEYSTIT